MRRLVTILLTVLLSISLIHGTLTVRTHQGAVTGTFVTPRVRRFLGIPYAVAERWEAPRSPPHRDRTLPATSFGNSCVQQLNRSNRAFLELIGLGDQIIEESETCLNVNIWTPISSRRHETAVMLWLHGGGFEFGTSNTSFYDGLPLVENNDDLIVVTVEYRKSIFGFPNAPQLSGRRESQNFGALDVEAAIRWVHDNIAAFGGSPHHITLFGQSAGAAFVSAYTFSHPRDTIVKGVIQQSGSLAGLPSLIPTVGRQLSTIGWQTVSNVVGCGNASTLTQLACMKAVPFRTLVSAVVQTHQDFLPVQDEITFFTDSSARSAAGNFLHVPILVGNTGQEADIFELQFEKVNIGPHNSSLLNLAAELLTQVAFNCPTGTTARDYVRAGIPVWRYRYEAVFTDISSDPSLRAFHASEIPIVFGTFNQSTFGPPPTAAEIALSKYVQGAWVAFARDPHRGLLKYGWPLYNPQLATLARLGNPANLTGTIFDKGDLFDGDCQPDLQLVEALVKGLGVMF